MKNITNTSTISFLQRLYHNKNQLCKVLLPLFSGTKSRICKVFKINIELKNNKFIAWVRYLCRYIVKSFPTPLVVYPYLWDKSQLRHRYSVLISYILLIVLFFSLFAALYHLYPLTADVQIQNEITHAYPFSVFLVALIVACIPPFIILARAWRLFKDKHESKDQWPVYVVKDWQLCQIQDYKSTTKKI